MKFLFALLAIFALICAATVNAAEKSDCLLPKEIGPCRKSDTMYYFDGKECQVFLYGGCKGNNNRFETKEECEDLCK